MAWACRVLVGVAAWLVVAVLPASALALDPNDSISISPPVPSSGSTIYAGYPFIFSGSGTNDGAAEDYAQEVLFTPAASTILRPTCPPSLSDAIQAIDEAYGGPGADASHSALGVADPFIGGGPFTYRAWVNSDVIPTVTDAGSYVACAYLYGDLGGGTYAVSPAPVGFTVSLPPGSGTPPTGFGGPRGSGRPSNLTLEVAPRRSPIRAPGRNVIEVSGHFQPSVGAGFLTVTVKDTRHFNGCAANDEQDLQITRADSGAVLTEAEQVTPNSAGVFLSPVAMNYRKNARGTGVICAYLNQLFDDVAVGFERFTLPATQAGHKPKPKHKKRPSKHKAKPKKHG
jgi:hypothetical protein